MDNAKKQEFSAFCIRLPVEMATEIRRRASNNGRTLNKEITQMLKSQVKPSRKKKDSTPDSAI